MKLADLRVKYDSLPQGDPERRELASKILSAESRLQGAKDKLAAAQSKYDALPAGDAARRELATKITDAQGVIASLENSAPFKAGDRVSHDGNGNGTVEDINDDSQEALVSFDDSVNVGMVVVPYNHLKKGEHTNAAPDFKPGDRVTMQGMTSVHRGVVDGGYGEPTPGEVWVKWDGDSPAGYGRTMVPAARLKLENAATGPMEAWERKIVDRAKLMREIGREEALAQSPWDALPKDVQIAISDALAQKEAPNRTIGNAAGLSRGSEMFSVHNALIPGGEKSNAGVFRIGQGVQLKSAPERVRGSICQVDGSDAYTVYTLSGQYMGPYGGRELELTESSPEDKADPRRDNGVDNFNAPDLGGWKSPEEEEKEIARLENSLYTPHLKADGLKSGSQKYGSKK